MPLVDNPIRSRITFLAVVLLLMSATSHSYSSPEEDGERGIAEFASGNLMRGMELLQKSAEAGYAPAQTKLAYILDRSEDNDEAFKWFQLAAEQGDPEGMFGLGNMYGSGESVAKDLDQAFIWILRAANADYLPAMRVCAYAYEEGGFNQEINNPEALRWFTAAADRGDQLSIRKLAEAYNKGSLGLQIDLEKSAQWLGRIAKD